MNLTPFFLPLLDLLMKGVIIVGAGASCLALARNASAANRHAAFVALFAALLLLPLTMLVKPHWSLEVARAAVPTARKEKLLAGAGTPTPSIQGRASKGADAASQRSSLQGLPWMSIFVGIWLGGAMLLVTRRMLIESRLRGLTRNSTPIEDSRRAALAWELAAAQGIRVTVRESATCRVPLVAGAFRPMVLLPTSTRHWSEDEVASALWHEFGHVRRRDCLTRLIADVARAIHWINPFVWILGRQMRIAQEQACDDLVLSSGVTPERYAEQLVTVVRSLQADDLTSRHALAMAQPSTLEVRVLAIMDPTRRRVGRSGRGTFAGIACVLGLLAACAAARLESGQSPATAGPGITSANAGGANGPTVSVEAKFIQAGGKREGLPDFFGGKASLEMPAEEVETAVKDPVFVTAKLEQRGGLSAAARKEFQTSEAVLVSKEERPGAAPKVSAANPDPKPDPQQGAAGEFAPLDIVADRLNGNGRTAMGSGNVRVKYRDATMTADQMFYDRESRTVTLTGTVRFENREIEISAENLSYGLESGKIRTEGPSKTKVKDPSVPKK